MDKTLLTNEVPKYKKKSQKKPEKWTRHKHTYETVAIYRHLNCEAFSKSYEWICEGRVCTKCGRIDKRQNLIFTGILKDKEKASKLWNTLPHYYMEDFCDDIAKKFPDDKNLHI